jgi:hypothetical protein
MTLPKDTKVDSLKLAVNDKNANDSLSSSNSSSNSSSSSLETPNNVENQLKNDAVVDNITDSKTTNPRQSKFALNFTNNLDKSNKLRQEYKRDQFRRKMKIVLIVGLILLAIILLATFCAGLGISVYARSASLLCEGIDSAQTPFILVNNCQEAKSATLLSGSTFCINIITKNCFDVSSTAHTRQVVGFALLWSSIALIIVYIICAFIWAKRC